MNSVILPPAMGNHLGRLISLAFVWPLVLGKNISKFKPVKLSLKIDLVSHPDHVEGLLKYIVRLV